MSTKLKELLERVEAWPEEAQEELIESARVIERRRMIDDTLTDDGVYHATAEELAAIDDADRVGIATDAEVESAFRTFRGA